MGALVSTPLRPDRTLGTTSASTVNLKELMSNRQQMLTEHTNFNYFPITQHP